MNCCEQDVKNINIVTEEYELNYDGPVVFLSTNLTNYYTKNEADAKFQDKNVIINDVEVEASSWVADEAYIEYPYAAELSIEEASADKVATVVFDVVDAISGNFAPVNETGAGTVKIWAKEIPASNMIIPTIFFI